MRSEVEGSAATDISLCGSRNQRERVRDTACGELRQGRLHIGGICRRGLGRERALQPGVAEGVPTRALGCRAGEVRIGEQARQQPRLHPAAGGPASIGVVGAAKVPACPGVEQAVAGTGVEADHAAIGRQQGHVGHAANVDDCARLAARAERGGVEGRHQRRALAAGRHVAAAKVGDDIDSQALGNDVGIANLQGERGISPGAMQDRLSMTADGTHRVGGHSGRRQQMLRSQRQLHPHGRVQLAELAQPRDLGTFGGAAQPPLQVGGPFTRDCRAYPHCLGSISSRAASIPSMLVPDIKPM